MKNKIIVILLIVITLLVVFKFIPFGITKYTSKQTNVILEIPKLSIFEKECCMFSVSFKTFRSKVVIEKELEKIMNSYEKRTCNNKIIYYNKEQNITITEYGVEYGFIMNTFYITYDKGVGDINECSIITDPKKLTYSWKTCPTGICYLTNELKYKNKDGNIYNLYYEISSKYLLFQTGTGNFNYFDNMLRQSWISMHDVIDFLEYQVENNKATKEFYKDGGSIMYKNKDFSLLKCNTIDGNQDIYIGNTDLEYEKNFCKNLGVEVE